MILILLIILFEYLLHFYPKIKYNKKIITNKKDKLNLDIKSMRDLYSFRSYIYYVRNLDLNFKLMDKGFLYNYLKKRNYPISKLYYLSYKNFNLKSILNKLRCKSIIIKPTHLSEKKLCFLIKNGYDIFNKKKLDIIEIQNIITNNINSICLSSESKCLKKCKPGILIQKSLDIYDEINEWKCFCVWGKVIFIVWRENHKNDNYIIDSKLNCYPILFKDNKILPKFSNKLIKSVEKFSKNYPFIRVDILWNIKNFWFNEVEICPSGFYSINNEILLMKLIKEGYNLNDKTEFNFFEFLSYLNFVINRIEYYIKN